LIPLAVIPLSVTPLYLSAAYSLHLQSPELQRSCIEEFFTGHDGQIFIYLDAIIQNAAFAHH
jgi:hypothetical protein